MPFIDRSGLHIPGFAIPEVATGYSVVPGDYNANSGAEAAELIWTGAYGDGKPLDVGFDRQLAANFNRHSDYISCTQQPMLVQGSTEMASAGLSGTAMATASRMLFLFPVFTGLEILGTTVTRVIAVAPWFRSGDGTTAEIRITISDQIPTPPPGAAELGTGGYYGNPRFVGRFSRSTIWTTTSTTWATGAEYELNLGCKDSLGCVILAIEGSGAAECRGLASCRVSERRVA